MSEITFLLPSGAPNYMRACNAVSGACTIIRPINAKRKKNTKDEKEILDDIRKVVAPVNTVTKRRSWVGWALGGVRRGVGLGFRGVGLGFKVVYKLAVFAQMVAPVVTAGAGVWGVLPASAQTAISHYLVGENGKIITPAMWQKVEDWTRKYRFTFLQLKDWEERSIIMAKFIGQTYPTGLSEKASREMNYILKKPLKTQNDMGMMLRTLDQMYPSVVAGSAPKRTASSFAWGIKLAEVTAALKHAPKGSTQEQELQILKNSLLLIFKKIEGPK